MSETRGTWASAEERTNSHICGRDPVWDRQHSASSSPPRSMKDGRGTRSRLVWPIIGIRARTRVACFGVTHPEGRQARMHGSREQVNPCSRMAVQRRIAEGRSDRGSGYIGWNDQRGKNSQGRVRLPLLSEAEHLLCPIRTITVRWVMSFTSTPVLLPLRSLHVRLPRWTCCDSTRQ